MTALYSCVLGPLQILPDDGVLTRSGVAGVPVEAPDMPFVSSFARGF